MMLINIARLLPGNRPLCQRRWKPAGTTIMRQGLYAPGVPYANGISTPDSVSVSLSA